MDHNFAPAPPEMQSHGAPGPGTSFSHSHVLGRPIRPSRLPGGGSPLTPVLRKTIHLDTFPQSHIPQTSSRLGLGARTRSVPPQETGIALGASLSPLPTSSLVPRKLSSISLTLHQNSQARSLDRPLSHWEELPTPGKKAAPHEGGRVSSPGSPPVTLVPGGRVHSEGPGNPGLTKSNRMLATEKPLVSSYLALPFQSRLAQSAPVLAEPGSLGQGHLVSVTDHMPTRASPGKGKPRARGIPRPRGRLQRANTTVNLTAMDTRTDAARHLATMATNRPSLAINLATPNTSQLDTGTEFPALDIKLGTARDLSSVGTVKSGKTVNLATAGTIKPGTAMNLTTVGTTKPGMVMDLIASEPDKLGKAMATRSTAKPDMTTEGIAMDSATSDPVKPDTITATVGTSRLETAMALARVNRAKLGTAKNSLALDTSRMGTAVGSVVPVTPDPATGKTTLGSVNNLTISDVATCLLMPSRSTDLALDNTNAAMDRATEPASLDLATEYKGQSGLGKSTLVNTLFKSQVSRKASSWNREEKIPKTVEIKAIGHVIEEGGVKMKLTVIDTPGFGDQINNENCWEPIEKYINEQYEKFLKEEVNIARKKRIPDTRVHCCLYFISPTGHSLRPLDLEFMKHLSKVVNIIPVIAKADTMTLEEKSEFKQRVRKELEVNGIEFYPQKEFDEDLEDKTENDKIRQESMPFAVVGSDKEYQVNGKRVLGRKTPWGIIEVENLNHCEFALLRDFVIRTHLQDLKEVTHNIHYETYRAKRLNDNGGLPPGEGLLGTVLPPVPATPCPTAE
ncbi:neuronal-specific septin-3 isoform F [Homo sapiens]|uniref:neuronal-specific septin-3 isoform F n=1 Tax=Homo sapiens TaxID=9606 RepID=UPI0018F7E4D4|nr:neuronal-specific septin-3 isoform F [Homo sapiens]